MELATYPTLLDTKCKLSVIYCSISAPEGHFYGKPFSLDLFQQTGEGVYSTLKSPAGLKALIRGHLGVNGFLETLPDALEGDALHDRFEEPFDDQTLGFHFFDAA